MKYDDYTNFFDFDFFFDNSISVDRMLIYGMGFKKSGFIEDLRTSYPKYNKVAFWSDYR